MLPTSPIYTPGAVASPDKVFNHLWHNLPWEQRDAPRKEVFFSDKGLPYDYGEGRGLRTYYPQQKWDPIVKEIQQEAERQHGCKFEACFINGYPDQHHHLGWHADDSESIDHSRPILVVSFGAVREIWFKPRPTHVPEGDVAEVVKVLLEPGSCLPHTRPAGVICRTHVNHIRRIHCEIIST